jgi:hypothetical protein
MDKKQCRLIKIQEQNKAKVQLQSWLRYSLIFDLNAKGNLSLEQLW